MTTDISQIKADQVFTSLVKWSNIPPATQSTHRLVTFVVRAGCEKAHQAAVRFADSEKREHPFLTLVGKPGVGKTHLAFAVGWEWVESYQKVKYFQAGELLDYLRRGFHFVSNEEFTDFDQRMSALRDCSLLILDDLGVEQSTGWAQERLDIIINFRYTNEMPTLVTTNLSPDSLAPRIASRLSEGRIVLMEGADYRIEKARMRKAGK